MLLNRLSMRVSLIVTIVAMGLLGMALAFVSGGIYREHAIVNERAALAEQIRIRINDIRQDLDAEARGLAAVIQMEPTFRVALAQRDQKAIAAHLQRVFRSHAVTAGEIRPVKLYIYDPSFNLVAAASPTGVATSDIPDPICAHIRTLAARRKNGDQAKPLSGNCVMDKHLYYAAVLALGAEPSGYMHVVVDLLQNLTAMETATGMPLKLAFSDGAVLYKSPSWPAPDRMDKLLVAQYALNAYADSKIYLVVSMLKDTRAFYEKLESTQYLAMIVAASATLLFILIALALLQKTAIDPLRALSAQLRLVMQDETQLGKRVKVAGNAEVVELGKGFNEMTTRLEELYENLEHMAFTDPLTQLPNRKLFHDRLEQAVATARRDHKPFALFIMDLDRFKDINDTLGHHIGDMLLQQVALRLRGKLRESDTVARMGGDEFAVLLPTVNAKYADMAARMLVQALRTPFVVDAQSLDIGTSIGIALYPDHGIDTNVLIQRADVAMYAAKNSSSGHALYDPRMDQNNPSRLALMGELRQAVDQEQFVLYYQPKVSLQTNRVTGVEALVRWRRPSGDLTLPDTFIPLLEQSGLIRNLTAWVVNEALRQGRDLRSRGFPLAISVNLSMRDLHDPYLAQEFSEQLAVHHASPDWLELEITESAVMTDSVGAIEVLTRLSSMGFKVTIDDFGTGYSSLAYLKKLPVESVKIDKSFVMGMASDANDAAIVHTSIDLAHNLGLNVVAEGVDDEESLKRLVALGCDVAQGTYISRPLSNEELSEWLLKSSWAVAPPQARVSQAPSA